MPLELPPARVASDASFPFDSSTGCALVLCEAIGVRPMVIVSQTICSVYFLQLHRWD